MMKKIRKSKLLLDIGCGVGTLTFYLKQFIRTAVGIDISSRAIGICEHAKESMDSNAVIFRKGILKEGNQDFDFILCSEVIEHIENDQQFLKVLYSNLRVGGTLFLTTPSKENLLYRVGFYNKFDEEVGHFRRYKKCELIKLFHETGFIVEYVRSVEGPLRNVLFTTNLGFLIRFMKGPLVLVFHFFDFMSGLIFGFSDIQVVATRK